MTHYILNTSLNNKIIGKYPQVEHALYACSVWDDPRFIDHEKNHFKKTATEPIIAKAVLVKKAKLTDWIYPGIIGFHLKPVISGKLKSILEKSKYAGIQVYQSPVIFQEQEVSDYWVLNPYLTDHEWLDFSKSSVFLMRNTSKKVEQLPVVDYNDFASEKKRIEEMGYPFSIFIERPVFFSYTPHDILILTNVGGGVMYIASEKLKWEIEESGITGIEFRPTELTLNEWLGSGGPREKIYGKV